jgi:hypothetical protein
MEHAGAKPTDIQARPGHSNAATTGVYPHRLHAGETAYADAVAALFGISPARCSARRSQAYVLDRLDPLAGDEEHGGSSTRRARPHWLLHPE